LIHFLDPLYYFEVLVRRWNTISSHRQKDKRFNLTRRRGNNAWFSLNVLMQGNFLELKLLKQ